MRSLKSRSCWRKLSTAVAFVSGSGQRALPAMARHAKSREGARSVDARGSHGCSLLKDQLRSRTSMHPQLPEPCLVVQQMDDDNSFSAPFRGSTKPSQSRILKRF